MEHRPFPYKIIGIQIVILIHKQRLKKSKKQNFFMH